MTTSPQAMTSTGFADGSLIDEQRIEGDENPVTTNGPSIGSEEVASAPRTRTETDSLGSLEVPAEVYWGIHTARALDNFPITRRAIFNYPT